MPSPDTLTELGLTAVMAALLLSLRLVRPIGSPRPRHGVAWLDAHDVPAEARHYRLAIAAPVEPAGSAEDACEVTSPWVVPDVPATIPDALTNVRTA